ncbi:DUF4282 domain-containing protein [Enterobacter sp. ASE]|uniref:DUF4282 domain-containing protein n=1 Tax=Enterobacter sp. ASE TaxID=2905968 RepID=UPI001E5E326C|nr:DUF4282 domain-containing protein [Enterobacter sp. ASE]MCE3116867.1 DUF4282 domain-containing protein [Enterobacter sp. ASE]
MNIFNLNNMITPKILTGIYILTTVLAALACVFTFIGGSPGGALAWGLIALFNRIFFECIIVAFKNNEYLKRSAESLQEIAKSLAEVAADNKKRALGNAVPDADFSEAGKAQTQTGTSQDKQ